MPDGHVDELIVVRGDDDQAPPRHLGQHLANQLRRLRIEFGRRLVGEDHAAGKQDAGDADAHALPAGEIVAAFRDAGLESARQQPFVEQPDVPGAPPRIAAPSCAPRFQAIASPSVPAGT